MLIKTEFTPRQKPKKHISSNLQAMLDEGSVKKRLSAHFDDEFLNKVVSPIGYTHIELHTAFELICNKENWKEPIDAEILAEDFDVCQEACSFITGSALVQVSDETDDGKIQVEADGYYVAIGS